MENEINLEEIFSMFWKKRGIILVIVLLFILLGWAYINYFKTPKYTSTVSLILVSNEDKNDVTTTSASSLSTDLTINSKLVSTYSSLIKSNKVLDNVKSKLGLNDDVEKMKKEIDVSSISDTEIIKISVTDANPNKACDMANTLYDVFANEAKAIYQIDNVHLVDKAEVPTSASNMNKAKDLIIFTAIGIFVSIVYVVVENALDTTVKNEDEIEKMCSAYVLASIPSYKGEKSKGGIY